MSFLFTKRTLFHAFMYCNRLRTLFSLLQDVFKWFDEVFSMEILFVVLNILENVPLNVSCLIFCW